MVFLPLHLVYRFDFSAVIRGDCWDSGRVPSQAAPPPPRPRPQLDLNHPPMDEDAPAGKLSRLEHQRSVGDDPSFRMENLPEEIQPVVMSLLPLKEAVRTSIVARSWRMLWRFHSNLCFYGPNDLDYDSDEYDDTDEQAIDDFIKIKRDNFIEDVNWVIQRHSVVFGDLRGLLANCSALEDLAIIECSGVANLSMPHKLDKLQHLLIDKTYVRIVEFRAADLAHFEYKGLDIPIVLHGYSKLEKATMMFEGGKGLGCVFTLVPSILPVKILHVRADILGYEQLQKMTTRSHGMFTCLRHMTCQLFVRYSKLKADNGVLQVAHCLNVAPQLETLHLNMIYLIIYGQVSHEAAVEEDSPMRRMIISRLST
ncbi:hypothetical protein ACQ4PT_001020 [Festuca glaucescens]